METVSLMRYGIDLDGVLVDMHKGLAEVINSIWPARIPAGGEVPTDWDLTSLGLSRAELGQVWRKVEDTRNWWMSLPAIPANVHALHHHRLLHPDDEIFYVTARTTETLGMPIMHQSQMWLESCGISGVGTSVIVVPEGEDKINVYERIGVQYALDDALHIVEQGPHIIYLLDQPYNRAGRSGEIDVVNSVKEFFKLTGDRK
jgi:uncharacterized HAD superfamily protein